MYIDAGTTTELMIDFLTEKGAVYITNGISHARKLMNAGYRVFLLGGEMKAVTEAIIGEDALENLEKYNFTKGFLEPTELIWRRDLPLRILRKRR